MLLPAEGCRKDKERNDGTIYNNKRLRDVLVSYMSEPRFRNADFVQQVTGTGAELKLYDMDQQMLYFVIDKKDFDTSATLKKITIDPGTTEFGTEKDGNTYLHGYRFRDTTMILFSVPKNDILADSSKEVTIKYDELFYNISMNELADFADNIMVHGGLKDKGIENDKYVVNHGAFVSKPDEPSLLRLCGRIIKNETKKEVIAQLLLDFVTSSIKFSADEAGGEYEVMKRPNEVLMTGNADCSGMTILYASMLEQYGINYLLTYFPGHIAVSVEGNFPKDNFLNFNYEGRTYTMAETTARGFVIGRTMLLKKDITGEIRFVQKPGSEPVVYSKKLR